MLALTKTFAKRVRDFLATPVLERIQLVPQGPDAATQIQLMLTYRKLASENNLPRFGEIGFKCHSQTDEDGILLFIFSIIGVVRKLSVEICAGNGIECNTANLILNHGWHGLLVDGDKGNVEKGIRYFSRSRHTHVYPPQFVCAWITRDSANDILSKNNFSGEIDRREGLLQPSKSGLGDARAFSNRQGFALG